MRSSRCRSARVRPADPARRLVGRACRSRRRARRARARATARAGLRDACGSAPHRDRLRRRARRPRRESRARAPTSAARLARRRMRANECCSSAARVAPLARNAADLSRCGRPRGKTFAKTALTHSTIAGALRKLRWSVRLAGAPGRCRAASRAGTATCRHRGNDRSTASGRRRGTACARHRAASPRSAARAAALRLRRVLELVDEQMLDAPVEREQ